MSFVGEPEAHFAGTCVFREDVGSGRELPGATAGPGLSSPDVRRARTAACRSARPNVEPGVRAGGIRPGAEPVSQCLGSIEKPEGKSAGPRL